MAGIYRLRFMSMWIQWCAEPQERSMCLASAARQASGFAKKRSMC